MGFSWFWLVAVFLGSWYASWEVRQRASFLGLVHLPNNRSSHFEVTPHGGGLGFVLVATISCALLFLNTLWPMLLLAGVLAACGLLDDIGSVSPRYRFLLQVVVVAWLLFWLGQLPAAELFGIRIEGWILGLLIGLVGLWWINLFNFMDGIDAIASIEAISLLVATIALLAITEPGRLESPLIRVMLILIAAVLGFLVLNWPPARIFMGDVGSTWLAFMILALALLSIKQGWLDYVVWLILASVFVVDASITLIVRFLRRQAVYEAHRSHAYQKLALQFQRRYTIKLDQREARAKAHRNVAILVLLVNGLWLFPLAGLAIHYPEWGAGLVLLAWLPICMIIVWLGAGRPDTA